MRKEIHQRALQFSLRIINLVNLLPKTTSGFEFGKQLFRAGTSIGANIIEGNGAVSRKEFINYLQIAKKSAFETEYWLQLLMESSMMSQEPLVPLLQETIELKKILTSIILKSKEE